MMTNSQWLTLRRSSKYSTDQWYLGVKVRRSERVDDRRATLVRNETRRHKRSRKEKSVTRKH